MRNGERPGIFSFSSVRCRRARASAIGDTLTGTVTVRNANWKADYLASHVVVDDATLHIDNGDLRWDPVDFTYGPLKGTASLTLPAACASEQTPQQPCPAQFQMHFADLDAAAFESALLGARGKRHAALRPHRSPPSLLSAALAAA